MRMSNGVAAVGDTVAALKEGNERVTLGDEEGWEVAKRHADHGTGKETESGGSIREGESPRLFVGVFVRRL